MKRRDFIKTIGLSCVGSCFNPLGVLASGTTPLKRRTAYRAALPPLRINPLSLHGSALTASDGMAWDPAYLLQLYDEKRIDRRELYLQLFEERVIDDILDEMRVSYEELIPEMPYIGDFHRRWFIPNSEKLADYLVAVRYGVSKNDFSNLHLTQASKDLLAMGEEQLIAIGKMQFGFEAELYIWATAFWSQFRIYPDDYIIHFRKGDGIRFDWGLDYTQCANVQLYKKFDKEYGTLDLLLQMVCTQDYMAGSAMRTGYYRTMQIATGDPICDLRWKLQE